MASFMTYKNSNECGHIHVSMSAQETSDMLSLIQAQDGDTPRLNNIKSIVKGDFNTSPEHENCFYCKNTGLIANYIRTPVECFPCPKCLHGAVKESQYLAKNLSCDKEGNPVCDFLFLSTRSNNPNTMDLFKKFNILFGKALFVEIKGIGSSNNGITSDFMHFKAGTSPFEAYRWIEKNFPPFSVAKTTGLDPMPYV